MVRGEVVEFAVRHAADHPDRAMVERTTAALRWWLDQPYESGPTSQLNGRGAVAACERASSRLPDGRPAVLLPSATYATRAALDALGVSRGDEVIIPALDWTATYQAVLSLGARPVPVAIDPETLTLAPTAAAAARTEQTRAVVVCHLHGVAGDVPALRTTLPGIPIVEDCAAALGSMIDGQPVGTFGDYAVLSLGPGKTIDAGEGGVLLCGTPDLFHAAVAHTAHPLRQNLTGLDPDGSPGALSMRPHPLAAVLALYELSRWDRSGAVCAHLDAAERLSSQVSAGSIRKLVVGLDTRRENAQHLVPLLLDTAGGWVCFGSTSGATNLAVPGSPLHAAIESLSRLITLASSVAPTANRQCSEYGFCRSCEADLGFDACTAISDTSSHTPPTNSL
jgi:dTDP-4-amino-4,6-dideoxygalactose transaminase